MFAQINYFWLVYGVLETVLLKIFHLYSTVAGVPWANLQHPEEFESHCYKKNRLYNVSSVKHQQSNPAIRWPAKLENSINVETYFSQFQLICCFGIDLNWIMGFFFDLMKCFKSKFLADDWIILLTFDTAYALVTRIFRNYTNKYTLLLLPSWMLGTEMDALHSFFYWIYSYMK